MERFAPVLAALALAACGHSPTEPTPPPVSLAPAPPAMTISVDTSGCDFTVTSREPLVEPALGTISLNGVVRWSVQIPRTPHYELVPSSGQLVYAFTYRGIAYSRTTECRYVAPFPFVRSN